MNRITSLCLIGLARYLKFMMFLPFIANSLIAQQDIKYKLNIKLLYSNVPSQFINHSGNKNFGYGKIDVNYGITDKWYLGIFSGVIVIKEPVGDNEIFYLPNFGVNCNRIFIPRMFDFIDANLYGSAKLGMYIAH